MPKEHVGAKLGNWQLRATFQDDLAGTSSSWVGSRPAYSRISTREQECWLQGANYGVLPYDANYSMQSYTFVIGYRVGIAVANTANIVGHNVLL
eukprot:15340831-Ditylum_brightwellii.AAC.1